MTIPLVTTNRERLPGKPITCRGLKGHHQPIRVPLPRVLQRHLQHIHARVVLLQILPGLTDQPLLTTGAAAPEHLPEAVSAL